MSTSPTSSQDRDFTPMLRAAVAAVLLAIVVKVGSAILIAQQLGAGVRIANLWGWLPYLQFVTDRLTFTRITSQSTLALALTSTIAFAATVARTPRRQVIAGWWCGVLSIIDTLVVEFILDRIDPPYFDMRWTRWTVLVLAAALAVTAAWLILDRPWRNDANSDAGTPSRTALVGS